MAPSRRANKRMPLKTPQHRSSPQKAGKPTPRASPERRLNDVPILPEGIASRRTLSEVKLKSAVRSESSSPDHKTVSFEHEGHAKKWADNQETLSQSPSSRKSDGARNTGSGLPKADREAGNPDSGYGSGPDTGKNQGGGSGSSSISGATLVGTQTPPFSVLHEGKTKVIAGDQIGDFAVDIMQNPRALAVEEISVLFYYLQKVMRRWTKAHFRFELDAKQAAAFPLAELETKHPGFFRISQYVADGSQIGWRKFFTSKVTRPHLVYAILGEWFKNHVFGHTCFGLSDGELEKLGEIDILYLNWDGFVRTKERASLIKKMLNVKSEIDRENDLISSIRKLARDVLVVLEPLLPIRPKARHELSDKLEELIRLAAALHLSIRLTGEGGTVVALRSCIKSEDFVPTARQNSVNKDFVIATRDDSNDDALVIKMPCFPLVIATVPYGPTLKDYADAQEHANELKRLKGDQVDRKETDPIDVHIVKAVHDDKWLELPESLQRDRYNTSTSSRNKSQLGRRKRGSYIRLFTLNIADVYIEWTPVKLERGLTLKQAIKEAWDESHPIRKHVTASNFARMVGASAIMTAAAYAWRNKNIDILELVRNNIKLPNGKAADALVAVITSSIPNRKFRNAVSNSRRHLGRAANMVKESATWTQGVVIDRVPTQDSGISLSTKEPQKSAFILKSPTAGARISKKTAHFPVGVA